MDIGLREWLFVIGIIVIAVVLFDGWRRMSGNKNTLKFRLDNTLPDTAADVTPEIVSSARVVKKREPSLDSADDFDMGLHADTHRHAKRQPDFTDDTLIFDNADDSSFANPFDDDQPVASDTDQDDAGADYEQILIIHVVARNENGFQGSDLLQSILESGLRFGAMGIFHRHENITGHGDKLFSMANAINPGTFDLDDMEFSTRAVCFFMGLPGPRDSRHAFDLMIAAAHKLANELDGDIKDDHRSVLTAQTIEHYRQRIADFEHQQLTQKS